MRATGFVAAAAIVVIGAACGGTTGGSDGDRGGGAVTHGPGGAKVGTGGAASTGMGGSFGNSSGPPTGTNGIAAPMGGGTGGAGAAGASGACVAGMFCPSTAADGPCGSITFESTIKTVMMPGNVLLIFDRSFSMNDDWNGAPRYMGAGSAMISALTPLADVLTIGAVMYPSITPGPNDVGLSCAVDPFTSQEQLAFQPGAMALQKLQAPPPSGKPTPLYAPVGAGMNDPAVGATPTTEAVQAADVALQNSTLTGATVAVLITDGEPNCAWDQNTTTATVQKWLTQLSIKTYVVGLPGIMGNGPAMLNAVAQAGGTDQYIDAKDSMTLQTKLTEIVSSTVKAGFDSCSIDLTPPADPADKLQLVLTETVMGVPTDEAAPHDLGNGGGWTITPDGTHVMLVGSLCNDAMGGRFDALKFTYGCKELPPLPPNKPPD